MINTKNKEINAIENGLLNEYCYVNDNDIYIVKLDLYAIKDKKRCEISIMLYEPTVYYYCDNKNGDIILSEGNYFYILENCERIDRKEKDGGKKLTIQIKTKNGTSSCKVTLKNKEMVEESSGILIHLNTFTTENNNLICEGIFPKQFSALFDRDIKNVPTKYEFLDNYKHINHSYENLLRDSEDSYNKFIEKFSKNGDLNEYKKELNDLKERIKFFFGNIQENYFYCSAYKRKRYYLSNVINGYLKNLLEIQKYCIEINYRLDLCLKEINPSHIVIKPKIEEKKEDTIYLDKVPANISMDCDGCERTYEIKNQDTCPICLKEFTKDDVVYSFKKCKHCLCEGCMGNLLSRIDQYNCPLCKVVFRTPHGDQPNGEMKHIIINNSHLPGYERYDTIQITYSFPDGYRNVYYIILRILDIMAHNVLLIYLIIMKGEKY